METVPLSKMLASRSNEPYPPSLKVQIVAVDNVRKYNDDQVNEKQCLTFAVADASDAGKFVCYDQAKLKKITEYKSMTVRNIIKKDSFLSFTCVTKLFPCLPVATTPETLQKANNIIRPPSASMISLSDALSSPKKTRLSVQGKIVQEDAVAQVTVRNDQVAVKAIYISDSTSPKAKITLWRELTDTPYHVGDFVKVTDVVVIEWKNEKAFSSTSLTKVEKTEQAEETTTYVIVGACLEDLTVAFLKQDDTIVSVPVDLVCAALPEMQQDNIETYFLENCTPTLIVSLTTKGSDICAFNILN